MCTCNRQQVGPSQKLFGGEGKKMCKIWCSLTYTFWEISVRLLDHEDGGNKLPQNVAIWYSTRRHVAEDLDLKKHRIHIKLQNTTSCFVHFPVWYFCLNTLRTELLNCLNARSRGLIFRHRAFCIQGQAFRYSPENAFYIFNQQIRVYFINWYLLDRASLI